MQNGTNTTDLLRMAGLMTVFVGLAWVVQILGWNDGATVMSRFMWVMAAASACGAGVGLIVTAGSIVDPEAVAAKS